MATSMAPQPSRPGMNLALWTVPVLSGIFWSVTGWGKILGLYPTVWNQTLPRVPWFSAAPQSLFVFIGLCEFPGGVGLLLPAMTGVKPKLTSFAAIGLALVMILAAGFHIVRCEYSSFLPLNLVLTAVCLFIAYGRLLVRPIAPAPISAVRVLSGIVAFSALVFARVCAGLANDDAGALTNRFARNRQLLLRRSQ
jgi:DoxX-like family